ncbi:MAG TPA: large conductance mechanosensitive channel protein MscL [Thermoplasmata archaeon]|jgi:large conductance mechanosensitive channel|nr:large conductance mechanosensitive channel protein MscL [Thermoplasmata archaeon]
MSIRQDFVTFINQGNLVQLAIAFVIGAAFAALMTALVADIFTPLIGIFLHVNFSAWTYTVNGSTFMQGAFLNELISFVVIALVIFFVIALPYQRYQAKKKAQLAATTRACPECLSQIPLAATRCAFCTSTVTPVPPTPPAAAKPA